MMLNTFSVDLEGITSSVSRSQFDESELEHLANLFLQSGDTVSPLLLRQNTPLAFEVLEGHREYYAALKAQEIDSRFESIRAYIVPSDREGSILEQYEFFHSSNAVPQLDISEIDQKLLVSAIERSISNQINPLKLSLQNVSTKLDSKPTNIPSAIGDVGQLAALTKLVESLDRRIPQLPEPQAVSKVLADLNNLKPEELKVKLEKANFKGKTLNNLLESICKARSYASYASFEDIISRKDSSDRRFFTEKTLIKLLDIW